VRDDPQDTTRVALPIEAGARLARRSPSPLGCPTLGDCDETLKILMFGRGSVATFYGWALERAGHPVEFYVRPERLAGYGSSISLGFYDARSRRSGMLVSERFHVRLRADIPRDHDYDVIVVSVQSHQFEKAVADLDGCVSGATVLVLSNVWADPEQATSHLPHDQLAWGFPSAGGGFDANGVLRGALLKKMQFGTFRTDPTARELEIRELFRSSGFSFREQRDYREWLWVHFANNAALLPQALLAGSIRQVVTSQAQWKRVLENTMQDIERILIARGVDLSAHRSSLLLARLPAWLTVPATRLALRLSRPLRAMTDANLNEHEARGCLNGVMEEAHRLGVRVPHLEEAHRQLQLD
jgi:2-dehydropantoate 2-reductase